MSQSRESLVYRGTALFNQLSEQIGNIDNLNVYKQELRGWIRGNIQAKSKRCLNQSQDPRAMWRPNENQGDIKKIDRRQK